MSPIPPRAANAPIGTGRLASAVDLLREASLHHRSGRLVEAVAAYLRSIALNGSVAEAHYNLGVALRGLGRLQEAAEAYQQAVALKPGLAAAHFNLGNALHAMGRSEEAVACFKRAIALAPEDPDGHINLANALDALGRLEDAAAAYRDALALRPASGEGLGGLVKMRRMMCDWRDAAEDEEGVRRAVRSGVAAIDPFGMLALPWTAAEQLACARLWTRTKAAGAGTLPATPRKPHGKIRVGYLSADYRQHAMAVLAAGVFERHDRSGFDVIAYALGPPDDSPMRRRLLHAFDRFVDVGAMPPAEAAKTIQADGIDILVDLMGHTHNSCLPILAARPAPIQVNFLGFPGTVGAPFLDYIIGDPIVLPFAEQPHFDERIVHLPDCYQPNDDRRGIDERTPLRPACGLPESGFVFCCFNASYKIAPPFFDIWMRLLRAVPQSVLWLLDSNAAVAGNLRREAAARGIEPGRLVFAPRLPLAQHLARHRQADLFLDTLPCNAHTTASDALWAGLPVLTCTGATFAGRVAASLLRAVGLDALVTATPEAYEALALALARDPARLGELRRALDSGRSTAPLFDTARFTRHLEAAYLRMWELWDGGKPPVSFAVPS